MLAFSQVEPDRAASKAGDTFQDWLVNRKSVTYPSTIPTSTPLLFTLLQVGDTASCIGNEVGIRHKSLWNRSLQYEPTFKAHTAQLQKSNLLDPIQNRPMENQHAYIYSCWSKREPKKVSSLK